MASFFLWFVLGIICLVAALMLASYAIWYYENQKILDLAKNIKDNNRSSILNTGMGKRGFSSFDLTASINRSKLLAKDLAKATVIGLKTVKNSVSSSKVMDTLSAKAKKTASGLGAGVASFVKPMEDIEELAPVLPEERYRQDVDKLIDNAVERPSFNPPKQAQNATLDMAAEKKNRQEDDMNIFDKLELRILNRLKESDMTNYEIWLELGNLYKKFNQNEKAKEVFALVLKHASDGNKERARNELIGLN